MSDSTTAHTLYRPGDKVRFRFGSIADPADAGSLYGTYEGILRTNPWGNLLRVTADDQTMRPEGVTREAALSLDIISPDGATPGRSIYDVTLIERFRLPVWLLARADHPKLFPGRYRNEVTHALVFTSTSTRSGQILTVPYAPSAEAAMGWQIGASELTACGLPSDHALHGEQGWWVSKEVLEEVGVKFPEDEPAEPEPDRELERLRSEVERLTGDNRLLVQAAQDLRREVGTVAMRYARQHGWCDTVREALEEVGIEPIDPRHEVWLTIRVRATGIASSSDPSLGWTRDSISVDESGIADAIMFDGDWEDVEFDSVEFDVDNVEVLED